MGGLFSLQQPQNLFRPLSCAGQVPVLPFEQTAPRVILLTLERALRSTATFKAHGES
jgi:hypothetical protein